MCTSCAMGTCLTQTLSCRLLCLRGGCFSLLLDTVDKAGTSNQILRDVLGLEATAPLWVERQVESVIGRYLGTEMTRERVQELRAELGKLGLADVLPQALERVMMDADTKFLEAQARREHIS